MQTYLSFIFVIRKSGSFLKVKLPYDPFWASVGRSVCHDFLKGRFTFMLLSCFFFITT